MKRIKFLTLVAILTIYTGASTFAQSNEGKESVYFQYNPSKIEQQYVNAFSIGYNKVVFSSQNAPFFVETGAAAQYSFYSVDVESDYDKGTNDAERKTSFLSVKVPVNFGYNWKVADNITIAPYVGLVLRGNVYGRVKCEYEYENRYNENNSQDLFSDLDWKRFQLGWQIGANIKFNKLYVGYSQGKDFNEIYDNNSIKTHSITLGLTL